MWRRLDPDPSKARHSSGEQRALKTASPPYVSFQGQYPPPKWAHPRPVSGCPAGTRAFCTVLEGGWAVSLGRKQRNRFGAVTVTATRSCLSGLVSLVGVSAREEAPGTGSIKEQGGLKGQSVVSWLRGRSSMLPTLASQGEFRLPHGDPPPTPAPGSEFSTP